MTDRVAWRKDMSASNIRTETMKSSRNGDGVEGLIEWVSNNSFPISRTRHLRIIILLFGALASRLLH